VKPIYQFVPAGIFPKAEGSCGIYVKHHPLKDVVPHIISYHPSYTHIDTPDRELLIVADAGHNNNIRPLDQNFDSFISLSPTHLTASDTGLKWCMTNYIQNVSTKYDHNFMDTFRRLPEDTNRVKILSDSGGFQLGRGNISFIDPERLAVWYHHNSDIGMSLDIPIGSKGKRKFLKDTAKIQRANNRTILDIFKEKNSATELMNVVHGLTYEEQQAYHETVFEQSVHRMSMAGIYHKSIVEAVSLVHNFIMSDAGKHYNHVHLLGMFSNKILPVFIWQFKRFNDYYGRHILMTSDATTAIQQAIARVNILSTDHDEQYKFQKLGLIHQTGHMASRNIQSCHRTLNCSCPSCSAVKYKDVYSFINGRTVTAALIFHNMWQMSQYGSFMSQMAQQLSFKDYESLVVRQIGKRASRDTVDALRFAEECMNGGIKKATQKYSFYFRSLFTGNFTSMLDETVKEPPKTNTEYLKKLFSKYQKYHKYGITHKTLKIARAKESELGGGHKSSVANKSIKSARKRTK
jgi:hypothetical protein